MAQPNWTPTLEQVLGHKTERVTMKSKAGNDYETDVIPVLKARLVAVDKVDDSSYKYSIIDEETNLEYAIKVPGPELTGYKRFAEIAFRNVRGGLLDHGRAWYAADKVTVV